MSKEVMRQALEVLNSVSPRHLTPLISNARRALREALAEQPAQRKPLTDEQIDAAVKAWFENDIVAGRQPFSKRMRAAIEAAHGIKGDA